MNAQTSIDTVTAVPLHNFYREYLEERQRGNELEALLDRALILLDIQCDRLESRGVDQAGNRAFVSNIRRQSLRKDAA